jgi:sulfofructose kinase
MATVFCVGHAVQDFVFTLPHIPTTAEKHRASAFKSVGGGPAATAAVVVARLGGDALLAARLGADPIADVIEAELRAYGVDCRYLRRFEQCSSSLSAVLLDQQGERLIVNHLDPQIPSSAEWLQTPTHVCDAVLADTRWPEGALAALHAARAAGIPAVLDADRPIPPDGALLAAASHVAFSYPALREFTGDNDPVRALAGLQLAAWSCVTVGAEGVHVMHAGRHRHVPCPKVKVVDTLGAGDVWHGAFALALAEGKSEFEAVGFAAAAAALKVQRAGGRAGAPRRAEVEQFLVSQQVIPR